ncbi:cysteine synthase A [Brevibacterium sandarakinum]|uniref:N-(2-amino-2-carboxyethyl)-L-glutamate synthase n=2 Tax=Brevibacterium sandarakinum TaxID=629680 RepID=A0A1H1Q2S6_BRESA|nr:cysteine synthase A [Brevibacterium sandarakinum]
MPENIHSSLMTCVGNTPLLRLDRCFPDPSREVLAKLEMLNPAGSMKDRPARFIIEQGLSSGLLRPGMRLVESTSGNLGIALATMAKLNGLKFTAVVDPKTTPTNFQLLTTVGADIELVTELDANGGYLDSRVRRAQELAASDPDTVWVNQYANELNWRAYHETAGQEILDAIEEPVDYLVAAVSTTGSILGLARRLRSKFPNMQVVAVDAVGSVIFGAPPASREIPGYGASRVPELFSPSEIDDVIHVDDASAAQGCRHLVATEGVLGGGSSGAVVAALQELLPRTPVGSRIVTVLPDRGERYLDMVYDDDWVANLPAPQRESATTASL